MIGVRFSSLGFESSTSTNACVDLEWTYERSTRRLRVTYKAIEPDSYRVYVANHPDETPVCIAKFPEEASDEMFAFIETVQEVL